MWAFSRGGGRQTWACSWWTAAESWWWNLGARGEEKEEERKRRRKEGRWEEKEGEGKKGEKNYEHKRLQSCLVELPTSSIYYTSSSSQLSTHSLKKTVKSCETNIDSITYSDLQHKLEILDSQSCLYQTRAGSLLCGLGILLLCKVWSSQNNFSTYSALKIVQLYTVVLPWQQSHEGDTHQWTYQMWVRSHSTYWGWRSTSPCARGRAVSRLHSREREETRSNQDTWMQARNEEEEKRGRGGGEAREEEGKVHTRSWTKASA